MSGDGETALEGYVGPDSNADALSAITRHLAEVDAAIRNLNSSQNEFLRVLSSQQAGFDRLAGIVDAGPASLPVAFETVIALVLTALTDLDIGSTMGDPVDEAEGDSIRTIRFNERILRVLEWQAARRVSLGDADSVISIARAAGEWASSHHPGRLLSRDLEDAAPKGRKISCQRLRIVAGRGRRPSTSYPD